MNKKPPEHLYHVYKITEQDQDKESYIVEDPGTRSHGYDPVEPLIADIDHLPKVIVRKHLYYLQGQGFDHIVKSEELYMSFSFKPICHQIFRGGDICSAQPLSKTKQDKFCDNLKHVYKSLDEVIDFKQEGNSLG